VVGKNTTGMASVTDAPPIGVNVSPGLSLVKT
jgi:hypothetical protein